MRLSIICSACTQGYTLCSGHYSKVQEACFSEIATSSTDITGTATRRTLNCDMTQLFLHAVHVVQRNKPEKAHIHAHEVGWHVNCPATRQSLGQRLQRPESL